MHLLRSALLAGAALVALTHHARAQTPGAPTGCTPLSHSDLLAAFSDRVPAGSITPQTMRNLVCSLEPGTAITPQQSGVVCDGKTDNALAFGAFSSVLAIAKAGYFPPQSAPCLTSTPLTPPDGSTLWAQPGTVTLQATPDSTANPSVLAWTNVGSGSVYGLTLDGGGTDRGATAATLAQVFNSQHVTFDHVRFQHNRGIGLLFSRTGKSGVRTSYFSDIGNHWRTSHDPADRVQGFAICCDIGTSFFNFAEDNYFEFIGLDAISADPSPHFTASRNHIALSTDQLAIVAAPSYGACIYVANGGSASIEDNDCNAPPGNGVDVFNVDGITVGLNRIHGAGQAGIGFFGSRNGAITGNVIDAGFQWPAGTFQGGISMNGTVSNLAVSGNAVTDTQVTKTQRYGVWSDPAGSYANVWIDQSNSLTGNLTGPFGGGLTDYSRSR